MYARSKRDMVRNLTLIALAWLTVSGDNLSFGQGFGGNKRKPFSLRTSVQKLIGKRTQESAKATPDPLPFDYDFSEYDPPIDAPLPDFAFPNMSPPSGSDADVASEPPREAPTLEAVAAPINADVRTEPPKRNILTAWRRNRRRSNLPGQKGSSEPRPARATTPRTTSQRHSRSPLSRPQNDLSWPVKRLPFALSSLKRKLKNAGHKRSEKDQSADMTQGSFSLAGLRPAKLPTPAVAPYPEENDFATPPNPPMGEHGGQSQVFADPSPDAEYDGKHLAASAVAPSPEESPPTVQPQPYAAPRIPQHAIADQGGQVEGTSEPDSLALWTTRPSPGVEPQQIVDDVLPPQPAVLPSVGQLMRPPVFVRPAVPSLDSAGRKILEPRIVMAEGALNSVERVVQPVQPLTTPPAEIIPLPPLSEPVISATPMVGPVLESPPYCGDCHPFSRGFHRLLACMKVQSGGDIGVGYERLEFAPFEIEVSQPLNQLRFRVDSGYDWAYPDRAEYFWAQQPVLNQAAPGQVVDYQDIRFMWELGGKRFSVATEIPIRILDPENVLDSNLSAPNTAGLGDISLTTKTVLLDGDVWQITQMTRTIFNSGTVSVGRGTGHVSMEPGLLVRIRWTPKTYIHGQTTYLFPLGADPTFAGQVLKYGAAISHLCYDADNFAVIPTLEFVGWSVLNGLQTRSELEPRPLPGLLATADPVDGIGVFNVHPGIRFVHDKGGDCGLFEFGLSAGIALSKDNWYESLLRIECRWSY